MARADTLSGGHHCKEHRIRKRCSKCGRILKSHRSRVDGICCICDADVNLDEIWARRIRAKDASLLQAYNEKLALEGRGRDHERDRGRLQEFLSRKVDLKDVETFLGRKIELDDIKAFLRRKVI